MTNNLDYDPLRAIQNSVACAALTMARAIAANQSLQRHMRYFAKIATEHERELYELYTMTGITRDGLAHYVARFWTVKAIKQFYLEHGRLPAIG